MNGNVHRNLELITAELAAVSRRIDAGEVDRLLDAILKAGQVFVAGAGRSGLALRAFAMRLMHFGVRVYVVGEIVSPGIEAGDLFLVGSGSGETGSLVGMATKAKSLGAAVALVTTCPESTIGRLADVVLTIPAPSPKREKNEDAVVSAQPMGNLFEQSLLVVLDAMVMELMARTGRTSEEMFRRHANLE